jgi:hypothetical protein
MVSKPGPARKPNLDTLQAENRRGDARRPSGKREADRSLRCHGNPRARIVLVAGRRAIVWIPGALAALAGSVTAVTVCSAHQVANPTDGKLCESATRITIPPTSASAKEGRRQPERHGACVGDPVSSTLDGETPLYLRRMLIGVHQSEVLLPQTVSWPAGRGLEARRWQNASVPRHAATVMPLPRRY